MLRTKGWFNAKMGTGKKCVLRKQKGETESELLCKMETTEKLSGRKGRKDGERKN